MALRVKCTCGKSLKIPSELAGKKIACPGCKKTFAIPIEKFRQAEAKSSQAVASSKLPSKPAQTEAPVLADINDPANSPSELDLLGELSGSNSDILNDVQSAPLVDTKPCPGCNQPMAASARICTACGFDTVKGVALASSIGEDRTESLVKKVVKTAGGFALGVCLSAVGAAIGGVIWFVVARYTDHEVGYIALGVGFLSGLGMHVAGQSGTRRAGVVAAGMAVLSIIIAKAVVFFVVLAAFFSGDVNDASAKKQFVILSRTNELLDKRGVKSGQLREEQWEKTYTEADNEIQRLPSGEIEKRWKHYREAAKEKAEQRRLARNVGNANSAKNPAVQSQDSEDSDESNGDEPTASEKPDAAKAAKGLMTLFFTTMFGLFDLLWGFLAVSTAFRIGKNGMNRDSKA